MSTQKPADNISSDAAQRRHREIANASVTESRRPDQVLKDSQRDALAGTQNGAQPGDK